LNDQLQPHETVTEGVRRVLLERVTYIYDLMVDPAAERETAVHNARKSCKQIRALLRLVRDVLGDKVYHTENTFYRDISRLLAPIRDSAVMVEALDQLILARAADLPLTSFAASRDRLAARHAELSQTLLNEQCVMEQVAERMVNGRARLQQLSFTNATDDFTTLAAGLRRVYGDGRRAMNHAYASNNPHLFHEWRKQVKYLWHQLELLQPIWPAILGSLISDLHHLSDFLGQAHDLVELQRILHDESHRFDAVPDLPNVTLLIEQQLSGAAEAPRPLAQRLYCEEPSIFMARIAAYWAAWQLDTPATREALWQSVNPVMKETKTAVPPLLTTQQAASQLAIPVTQIRHLLHTGQLRGVKIGQIWAIPQTSLSQDATTP
jgi:excisionase family DNA binding protein